MSANTLTDRASGETITATFFNSIHSALNGDVVGRSNSGVPEAGKNLGTVAIPWGTVRADQMILSGQAVDASQITVPQNRVKSGKVRTTSNQPQFITPNGAALSFIIDATPTHLNIDVNGVDVDIAADITVTGITAAPSTQNTALVNDTDAADQHDTRLWGEPEHRKKITIDTVGTNITALIGKYAAFMISNGGETEYFMAYVESGTVLSQIRRGYFYDSTLAPKNRIVFSNNDTITLLKMGWVFVENDGTTADVSYANPVWSFTSPGGPATGDYWYDMNNQTWKRYDGAAFQIISRTLVGVVASSSSACVAARCEDFYKKYTDENTMLLAKFSTEIVKGAKLNQKASVAGVVYDFGNSLASWNITTDLASSSDMYDPTEQASRMYYLYLTDEGDTVISDISPYFRSDLYGEYHPHNPWRCVGLTYNDSGSDLQSASSTKPDNTEFYVSEGNGYGSTNTFIRRFASSGAGAIIQNSLAQVIYNDSVTDGASFTCYWPGKYCVTYMDLTSGGSPDVFGVSANLLSGEGAASIGALPTNTRIYSYGTSNTSNMAVVNSFTTVLNIGDVLYAHTDSSTGGIDGGFPTSFRVSRVS